eukprot:TRINITY_DN8370_c0_g1_i2.p2 TRINITY_DN8370_c0_g1~~TRINITY_DN8370_c0_g1_i2.p2  ORF type:complete len:530 (-),score=129.49 TRINITY_DN8370_c0_g1_i2:97-1686(-)
MPKKIATQKQIKLITKLYKLASSSSSFLTVGKIGDTDCFVVSSSDIEDIDEEDYDVESSSSSEEVGPQKIQWTIEEMLNMKDSELCKDEPEGSFIPKNLRKGAPPIQNNRKGGKGYGNRKGKRSRTNSVRKNKVEIATSWTESDDLSKHDEMFKLANSNLNKISYNNFESILEKILSLSPQIDSLACLKQIVNFIYEKAVVMPQFNNIYADLCSKLINTDQYPYFLRNEEEGCHLRNFRRMLLSSCQQAFESAFIVTETDDSVESREREFIRRSRLFGNIKFIGQLYMRNILKTNAVINIVQNLLQVDEHGICDTENLEQLCGFISTIGSFITPKVQVTFNPVFEHLQEITTSDKYDRRIKYLIMDLLDLKRNNWVAKDGKTQSTPYFTIVRPDILKEEKRNIAETASQNPDMQFIRFLPNLSSVDDEKLDRGDGSIKDYKPTKGSPRNRGRGRGRKNRNRGSRDGRDRYSNNRNFDKRLAQSDYEIKRGGSKKSPNFRNSSGGWGSPSNKGRKSDGGTPKKRFRKKKM